MKDCKKRVSDTGGAERKTCSAVEKLKQRMRRIIVQHQQRKEQQEWRESKQ